MAKKRTPPSGTSPSPVSKEQPPRTMSCGMAYLGMGILFLAGLCIGTVLPGILSDRPASQNPTVQMTQTTAQRSVPQAPTGPARLTPAEQQRIRDLERLCAEKPREQGNWIDLGNAYFDADMPNESIKAYTTALIIGPEDPDVLTDLGVMYRRTREYDQALTFFRRAYTLNPDHIPSQLNEGIVLYHDLKKTDEAVLCWKKLLQKVPNATLPNGERLDAFLKEISGK